MCTRGLTWKCRKAMPMMAILQGTKILNMSMQKAHEA